MLGLDAGMGQDRIFCIAMVEEELFSNVLDTRASSLRVTAARCSALANKQSQVFASRSY